MATISLPIDELATERAELELRERAYQNTLDCWRAGLAVNIQEVDRQAEYIDTMRAYLREMEGG